MNGSEYASEVLFGHYTQFLSAPEYEFTPTYGSWAPTNASLVVEKTFRFPESPLPSGATYNTLRIQPLTASIDPNEWTEFSLVHSPKTIPSQFDGDSLAFFVHVYALNSISVSLSLETSLGEVQSTEYIDIPAMTWTLVRSKEIRIPFQTLAITAQATINFRTMGQLTHCHISHPALVNSYGFADNLFLRESFAILPDYLRLVDSEQQGLTYPMSRLMEVGLVYADRAFRQAQDFQYLDIASGFDANDLSTRSTLVDPTIADPKFLPWLGQFVGVRLLTSAAGTTPWGNLPEQWEQIHTDIDPEPDVTYFISAIGSSGASLTATPSGIFEGNTITVEGTNNFDGQYLVTSISGNQLVLEPSVNESDEFTGSVTLVDSNWIEIESFDTGDANFVAGRRTQISSARTGLNSGTKEAIESALQDLLTGTKWYEYSSDPFTKPWVITLKTLVTETPGGVIAEQSDYIVSKLYPVKPMGFVIEHECVDLDQLYEEPLLTYDSSAPYDGYDF